MFSALCAVFKTVLKRCRTIQSQKLLKKKICAVCFKSCAFNNWLCALFTHLKLQKHHSLPLTTHILVILLTTLTVLSNARLRNFYFQIQKSTECKSVTLSVMNFYSVKKRKITLKLYKIITERQSTTHRFTLVECQPPSERDFIKIKTSTTTAKKKK